MNLMDLFQYYILNTLFDLRKSHITPVLLALIKAPF